MNKEALTQQIVEYFKNLWGIFLSWKFFDRAMFMIGVLTLIVGIIGLVSIYLGYRALREGAKQSADIAAGVTTLSRIQIFQLADRSMMIRDIRLWDTWDGADANAYEQLVKIAKDSKNVDLAQIANKQVERVQRSYIDSSKLVAYIRLDMGVDKDGKLISNEGISTKDLKGFLKSENNTLKTYSRAAQLLADRGNEPGVLESLFDASQHDPSLLIRKIALDSFIKITACKINSTLDFESIETCWKNKGVSK